MKFSLEWLNDFVPLEGVDPAELGELVTLHVAEVGAVEQPGGGWPGVVVGRVLDVRPHPDAAKLRLVRVETGSGQSEVVCGAPNVAADQLIMFAPEGTTLPGGLVLKRRKIRGVESAGMVLSERELGIGDDHDGILVLDRDAPVGTPAADVLGGSVVLDVENTAITTRADLWGHFGMAREIAALLERPLKPLDVADVVEAEATVEVTVEAPDLCPRYVGWRIKGIRIEPSPAWLRARLESVGQRAINNIVDLTNYILLECGQPLHAFDHRQIAQGHIVVRRATAGERVATLDGVERTLPDGACVIADPERAVAVAGIMGLANSEVLDDTTEIILEIANFEMTSIRRTAAALGLRTESSVRFEKGLDPASVPESARRFVRLLKEICPTAEVVGGPCDVQAPLEPPGTIEVPPDYFAQRLGTDIADTRADAILASLGFGVERTPDGASVTEPSWRAGRDVSIPEDLLEEVGRIHGYDKIEPLPLVAALEPTPVEPERAARRLVRATLTHEAGLTEIHSYPFTTEEACRRAGIEPGRLSVANAEQPGVDLMVTSLLPNLLRAVAENLKYRSEVALYLVAPVFLKAEGGKGLPREEERVTIAIAGADGVFEVKGAVASLLDAFRLKGIQTEQGEGPAWLHPGRGAKLARGRTVLGWFGELHPRVSKAFDLDMSVGVADLDVETLRTLDRASERMAPISRFPTVPYDVAVVVDKRTPAVAVERTLRKVDRDLVRDLRLFDVYEGKNLPEGKRSLAYTIVFGALDRTLGTDEVENLRARVKQAVEKREWTLRM